MNNLSSYCGLVDAKIRASEKDLPFLIFFSCGVNFNEGLCTGQHQELDFCDSTSSYVLLTCFLLAAGSITHALNPALGPSETGMQGVQNSPHPMLVEIGLYADISQKSRYSNENKV